VTYEVVNPVSTNTIGMFADRDEAEIFARLCSFPTIIVQMDDSGEALQAWPT
jgi:hypothetical protein